MNKLRLNSNLPIGLIIVAATISFEVFNYATTQFSLMDFVGDASSAGIKWATMLAIAFCGIDLAGMAHIFVNNDKINGSKFGYDVWYLFGAWLLAAVMNAILTWWGVTLAMSQNQTLGTVFVDRDILIKYVPILVAVSVWLIRVLLIGTIAMRGSDLFSKKSVVSRQTSFASHQFGDSAAQPSSIKAQPFVTGQQTTLRMQ